MWFPSRIVLIQCGDCATRILVQVGIVRVYRKIVMDTIWFPDFDTAQGAKYLVLSEAIAAAVNNGHLTSGEKLPPVRELAYQVKVTPGTVAKAYSRLIDRGVLQAAVGRGTFVAEPVEPAHEGVLTGQLEVDSVLHNSDPETYGVNMMSPHLPSVGQPALMRDLLGKVAQDPPSGLMHYPTRASSLPAREAVAGLVSTLPLGQMSAEDVVLANGGQNGIMLVMQTLLKGRKPVVLVEELSYPGFRRAAEMLRADVISVPMDEDGIIPEALEAAARTHEAQLLCTSPEVHNPTCGFTPEARRREIAEVARRCNFDIMEDDCYRMLTAQASSYRQILPDQSWFVGSISKQLTPALRVGYVIAPPGRAGVLRRSAEHSFFGIATPMSDLAAALLSHDSTLDMMRDVADVCNSYVEVAVNILGGFDLSWRKDVLFLWLKLPQGWRASAFCRAAEELGVKIRSAEDYQGRNDPACHAVRLAVNGGVSLKSYERALIRLRDLLDSPPEQMGV